jgi:hypothetical protein
VDTRCRVPRPRLGRETLHDDGTERGEIQIGPELGAVAGGARRREDRIGEVHGTDTRAEIDVGEGAEVHR